MKIPIKQVFKDPAWSITTFATLNVNNQAKLNETRLTLQTN